MRTRKFWLLVGMIFLITETTAIKGETLPPHKNHTDTAALLQSLIMPLSLDAENASCYASYFLPVSSGQTPIETKAKLSFVVSAGHCGRNVNSPRPFFVEIPGHGWHPLYTLILHDTPRSDIYIGAVEEKRQRPTYFTIYPINDFPLRNESVFTVAKEVGHPLDIQRLRFNETSSKGLLVFKAENDIHPGFSGAPVVTNRRRLIGIVVGFTPEGDTKHVHVFPITKIMRVFNNYIYRTPVKPTKSPPR